MWRTCAVHDARDGRSLVYPLQCLSPCLNIGSQHYTSNEAKTQELKGQRQCSVQRGWMCESRFSGLSDKAIWLSMHASIKSHSYATRLLTRLGALPCCRCLFLFHSSMQGFSDRVGERLSSRSEQKCRFVRLPIPGCDQLDSMNSHLSDCETQAAQMLRVPFLHSGRGCSKVGQWLIA